MTKHIALIGDFNETVTAHRAIPLALALTKLAEPGSTLANIYGTREARETYHCRFGLAPRWAERLEEGGALKVAARDDQREVRAVELTNHPFFIATLFQPERSALAGEDHPLISAFVRSC